MGSGLGPANCGRKGGGGEGQFNGRGAEGSGARREAAPRGPGFAFRRLPCPASAAGSRPGSPPGGEWGVWGSCFCSPSPWRRRAACPRSLFRLDPGGRPREKRPLGSRSRRRAPSPALLGRSCGFRARARLPQLASRVAFQGPLEVSALGMCRMPLPPSRRHCRSDRNCPLSAQLALLFPLESVLRRHRWLGDLLQLCRPRLSLLPLP